jgi:hypothetical protein
MADQELAEILSEYQNLAESEHQSFVSGLLHSATFAATVFSALQIYEVRSPVLCSVADPGSDPGVKKSPDPQQWCCDTRNDLLQFWFRL